MINNIISNIFPLERAVRALMEDDESLCVAEKLGVVVGKIFFSDLQMICGWFTNMDDKYRSQYPLPL